MHCMQSVSAGMLRLGQAGLLWAALGATAQAANPLPLRICADERAQPPIIDANGGGLAGQLIRQVAAQQHFTVTFYGAPITRCREEMRIGVADAFPTTPYTPSLLGFLAFPMQHGKPDPLRAVVIARALAFRRVGSQAAWDGKKFSNMHSKVLVSSGAALLVDRLSETGVAFDDKGKTLDQVFLKLLADRGEIALGAEFGGTRLLADARFAGKIEALPIPYSSEPYFLAVTQAYYDKHPARVEKMWAAIARVRASAAYLAKYEKATGAAPASSPEGN